MVTTGVLSSGKIVAIDGDGALLMRLGALSAIGAELPSNLVHVLLDNGLHESTGGQAMASATVDFCALAAASGYPKAVAAAAPAALGAALAERHPVRFIHVPIVSGIPEHLPRPAVSPAEVAARLRAHLGA